MIRGVVELESQRAEKDSFDHPDPEPIHVLKRPRGKTQLHCMYIYVEHLHCTWQEKKDQGILLGQRAIHIVVEPIHGECGWI